LALKATIYKAELQVSDLDKNHYQAYQLTIARHPSETNERMMLRLIAFALNADDSLSFTKGLSTDDEPDLWRKSLSNEIDLWIEIGQPSIRRIRKAAGKAGKVIVYGLENRSADIWWQQLEHDCQMIKNLSVYKLVPEAGTDIATLAQRNMHLSCTIQDDQILLSGDDQSTTLDITELTA
jgi:uncharacterized protein YaeQ